MGEKRFLEKLERNYGVYLDTDIFIKNLERKRKEIKTYRDLYEYIGTDFGRNKTDYELIIDAYDNAIEKGYIYSNKRRNKEQNIQNNNNMNEEYNVNNQRDNNNEQNSNMKNK